VAFVLKETLPAERRTSERVSAIGNPIRSMAILFRSRFFICLTGLIALSSCAFSGYVQIQFYFLNVSRHRRRQLRKQRFDAMCLCRWSSALTRRISRA
jgi:hypothetical protein